MIKVTVDDKILAAIRSRPSRLNSCKEGEEIFLFVRSWLLCEKVDPHVFGDYDDDDFLLEFLKQHYPEVFI